MVPDTHKGSGWRSDTVLHPGATYAFRDFEEFWDIVFIFLSNSNPICEYKKILSENKD